MGTHFAETSFVRGLLPNAILAVTLTGGIWTPLCLAQPQGRDWQSAAGGRMTFDAASVKGSTTAPASARSSSFPLVPGDVYVPQAARFQAMSCRLGGCRESASDLAES